MHVLLVDPSLFTAPYDAALTTGLDAAGVISTWATRATRPGDKQEIPTDRVEALFYRRLDNRSNLAPAVRKALKGVSHAVGLGRLVKLARTSNSTVVHFQWTVVPIMDAFAMALLRGERAVVVTVHDTVAYNGERKSLLQRLGIKLPLRLADGVIVHTQEGRRTLEAQGVPESKISVVPHGPLQLSSSGVVPFTRTDKRYTFTLFGELKPYKGVDLLVDAVSIMQGDSRHRARFIVAGRPLMDLNPIYQRIEALSLTDSFEIRPRRLAENEMAALFNETDCFVFPYRQVDASGVYFLVKGLGKWIIASNVGIFAEELTNGASGALVPALDIEAFAKALQAAVERQPQPQASDSASDWTAIGSQTKAVYERARARRFANPAEMIED